jgi:hypothetical protein
MLIFLASSFLMDRLYYQHNLVSTI